MLEVTCNTNKEVTALQQLHTRILNNTTLQNGIIKFYIEVGDQKFISLSSDAFARNAFFWVGESIPLKFVVTTSTPTSSSSSLDPSLNIFVTMDVIDLLRLISCDLGASSSSRMEMESCESERCSLCCPSSPDRIQLPAYPCPAG